MQKKSTPKFIIPLCITIGIILVGAVAFGIVKSKASKKAGNFSVAFYNLPDEVTNPLKEKITAQYSEPIDFVELSEENLNNQNISQDYDLLFTWNGSLVNQLEKTAGAIPGKAYSYIIQTEIPESGKYLPLVLDHWEVAYYIRGMKNIDTEYPQSLEDLRDVLTKMKAVVFVPMYCSGGYDQDLLAFVSAFTDSLGGYKAYANLVQLLSTKETFKETLDENLTENLTFRTVLDTIKVWKEEDLLYRKFIFTKDGELYNLGEERDAGAFFTSLSKHREMPLSITEGYTADRFPLVNNNIEHALIGNAVVCVKLTEADTYDEIITSFVTPEFQTILSQETKLGPVSLTASSYDRQSDDVRYLAAVSEKGVAPDLSKAAFQTAPEKQAYFAEQIRNYLN